MDALGKQMAMFGLLAREPVVLVHERAGSVDQHLGTNLDGLAVDGILCQGDPEISRSAGTERFDIVSGDAAPIHRRTHELEHKPGIVIRQIGIGIFEATNGLVDADDRLFPLYRPLGKQPGNFGETVAK